GTVAAGSTGVDVVVGWPAATRRTAGLSVPLADAGPDPRSHTPPTPATSSPATRTATRRRVSDRRDGAITKTVSADPERRRRQRGTKDRSRCRAPPRRTRRPRRARPARGGRR